jgi:hypothetical protein
VTTLEEKIPRHFKTKENRYGEMEQIQMPSWHACWSEALAVEGAESWPDPHAVPVAIPATGSSFLEKFSLYFWKARHFQLMEGAMGEKWSKSLQKLLPPTGNTLEVHH